MPRRPPSRLRSSPLPPPSPSNRASNMLPNPPSPLVTTPVAVQQELPAVLLDPCLAPEKFVAVCRHSAILAQLVDYIHSTCDFLSFIYVSKEMRALVGAAFDDPIVRHRFFARFLPGHPLSTRPYWNPRLRIDLTDLELFRAYIFRSRPSSCRLIQFPQSNQRQSRFLITPCIPSCSIQPILHHHLI
jgi:hypothetical protein